MFDINCISNEFQKINISIHKFTFANIILLIIASIIGSVGLLTNNYQSIIASKIIGLALIPFISLCIIIISLDSKKIIKSGLNCISFFIICLIIGIIIGIINANRKYVNEPTYEMLSRAQYKYESFYLEVIISFIAGIGVFYAIIKTSVVALIGLILVISIIPAICNAGLFYGMAFYEYITETKINENTKNYINYGNHSLLLFLSNIFGVFLGFLITFLLHCII